MRKSGAIGRKPLRKAEESKRLRTHKANGPSTGGRSSRRGQKPGKQVSLISSKLAYRGPLFNVYTDHVREPGGIVSRRDVVRHSGSVVILAVDGSRDRRDPLIVLEKQYRHAAGRYMWEVPAGRKEPGERPLPGAKRELLEETGYRAKKWTKLAFFYASPGFLGEWMQVYLAEELRSGEAKPEDDEYIEHRLTPLSQALQWIEKGRIVDAKSIVAILMYQRQLSGKLP
jgi:ADP-ribose pyrophosphatase